MFDDDRKEIIREPNIRYVHEPRTEVVEMTESPPRYSGLIDKYKQGSFWMQAELRP